MIGGGLALSYSYARATTDEELAAAAQSLEQPDGARDAASELLGRYRQQVYLWCYRYAGEHEAAMDMAQDALLRAYQKLGTFEGRCRFSSWLFAVTRSVCLNAVKKVTWQTDDEIEHLPANQPLPDEQFDTTADRQQMLRIIERTLDAQEQKAFVLRYFEQLKPDEITQIMKLDAKSGARGVLQRARRKLVAAVRKHNDEA